MDQVDMTLPMIRYLAPRHAAPFVLADRLATLFWQRLATGQFAANTDHFTRFGNGSFRGGNPRRQLLHRGICDTSTDCQGAFQESWERIEQRSRL
jgi:hypothetical protein